MQGSLVARKMYVHPSVKRVHCDKTVEKSVQIFILYERSFSLVFCVFGRESAPYIAGGAYRPGRVEEEGTGEEGEGRSSREDVVQL